MGNQAVDFGAFEFGSDLPVGVTTYIDDILQHVDAEKHTLHACGKQPIMNFEKTGTGAEDPWKPMKNVLTDISTNEFLTSDVMFNFLELIFQSFTTMIEKYCQLRTVDPYSIRFVYKGGNVLRFIAQKTLHQLPGKIALTLENEYGKHFKKSDADFSIYIDPSIANYESVFQEVTLLAAYTLDYIRTHFAQQTDKYLTVSRYNSRYLREMLLRYLAELQEEGKHIGIAVGGLALGSISTDRECTANSTYRSSPDNPVDMYITETAPTQQQAGAAGAAAPAGAAGDSVWAGGEPPKIRLYPLRLLYGNEERLPFYITVNDALEFDRPSGGVTKFNLARMKVNFNASVAAVTAGGTGGSVLKKLSGELIDVSIPHRKDGEVTHVFSEVSTVFQNYVVVDDTGKRELEIQSYTLQYMIYDLVRMLFLDRNFPWEDVKYEKRLKRLFFMYFVQILNTHSAIDSIASMLKAFRRCVSSSRESQSAMRLHKKIGKACDGMSGKDLDMYTFVTKLYPELATKQGDLHLMSRFDGVLNDQFDIMERVLDQIRQFQTKQDLVEVEAGMKVTLAGGATASPGMVGQLRSILRQLLQGGHTSMVHAQLADQINRKDSHIVRQLIHAHHEEAKRRLAAAPGRISVLWINPFRRTPLYWTYEERPDYVDTQSSAYIFRVLCATSRHHALLVEGVRDMAHRQTHCFSTKQPLHTLPSPE
jgi:hypothetical protein